MQKGADNVAGKDIINFTRKFTESVGDLISEKYASIDGDIKKLDSKDPDISKKKHKLEEQKIRFRKDLAIRKKDKEYLLNKLNDIMKQDVPNISLAKILEKLNLTDLTAREIAQLISEGVIKPMHIGRKSFEVLQQEYFSLKNLYRPGEMTDKELEEFNEKLKNLTAEIQFLPEDKQEKLYDNIDKMLTS